MTAFACGYRPLRAYDPSRERPVALDVWYPAAASAVEQDHDYVLGTGRVAEDVGGADGPFPLIVTSHGAFGSARSYAWIAEHLARGGYVVCGVSHYGESPVYGAETIDPLSVLEIGPRAVDCSFAIDHLLGGSPMGGNVDASHIGALGHSSGGATVVALAGGVFDPAAMRRYCASEAARDDRGCAYGSDPSRPPPDHDSAPQSQRDVGSELPWHSTRRSARGSRRARWPRSRSPSTSWGRWPTTSSRSSRTRLATRG